MKKCLGCGTSNNHEIKEIKHFYTKNEINFLIKKYKETTLLKFNNKNEGILCMKCFIKCFNNLIFNDNEKIKRKISNFGRIQEISSPLEDKYWCYNEKEDKLYPYPIDFIMKVFYNENKYILKIVEATSGPEFILYDTNNEKEYKKKKLFFLKEYFEENIEEVNYYFY
jgi:hypothetical protein